MNLVCAGSCAALISVQISPFLWDNSLNNKSIRLKSLVFDFLDCNGGKDYGNRNNYSGTPVPADGMGRPDTWLPYDYFEYLLSEIPNHMDDKDRSFLEDLLPWSEKLPDHCRKPKPASKRWGTFLSRYSLWSVYFTIEDKEKMAKTIRSIRKILSNYEEYGDWNDGKGKNRLWLPV